MSYSWPREIPNPFNSYVVSSVYPDGATCGDMIKSVITELRARGVNVRPGVIEVGPAITQVTLNMVSARDVFAWAQGVSGGVVRLEYHYDLVGNARPPEWIINFYADAAPATVASDAQENAPESEPPANE